MKPLKRFIRSKKEKRRQKEKEHGKEKENEKANRRPRQEKETKTLFSPQFNIFEKNTKKTINTELTSTHRRWRKTKKNNFFHLKKKILVLK